MAQSIDQLVADVFWRPEHPVNDYLHLGASTKGEVRQAIVAHREQLEAVGWLEGLRQERPSSRGQALAGGVAVVAFSTDGRVPKARGCE